MSLYIRIMVLIVIVLCSIALSAFAQELTVTPTPLPSISTTTTVTSSTTVSTATTTEVDIAQFGVITLRWRTESEQDNYGFNVYRGLSKDSSFDKINKEIVRGHGTTSEPNDYVYVDRTPIKGKTYFYYLMDVDLAGNTKKFTPIINRYLPADEEAKAEKEKQETEKKEKPEEPSKEKEK